MNRQTGFRMTRRGVVNALACTTIFGTKTSFAQTTFCENRFSSGSYTIDAKFGGDAPSIIEISSSAIRLSMHYLTDTGFVRLLQFSFLSDSVIDQITIAARSDGFQSSDHSILIDISVDDIHIRQIPFRYDAPVDIVIEERQRDFVEALSSGRTLSATLSLNRWVSNETLQTIQFSTSLDGFGPGFEEALRRIQMQEVAALEGRCEPSTGECFLTTACCDLLGRPDDALELSTLRQFRDEWLVHRPGGSITVSEYYSIAPTICDAIARDPWGRWELLRIYLATILPCVVLIKIGWREAAWTKYRRMVQRLQRKYRQ